MLQLAFESMAELERAMHQKELDQRELAFKAIILEH